MDGDELMRKELIYLILQFLEEEDYNESLHLLEQESKVFFNNNYFRMTMINGEWGKAEKYLSSFTNFADDNNSRRLFFEIRKQKYYEALDRKDDLKAKDILSNELKVLLNFYDKSYEELAKLLALKNFRNCEQMSWYTDTKSARMRCCGDLEELCRHNPVLRDRLDFPRLNKEGLLSIFKCHYPDSGKERSLKEELITLILQFLEEERFMATLHKLEQETGLFINLTYLEQLVVVGEWDKAENYLSSFTKLKDNFYSVQMYFEMRKQKYLEAVARENIFEATEIFRKDLMVFLGFNDKCLEQFVEVFSVKKFRPENLLANYADSTSVRSNLCNRLRKLGNENPILQEKLKFPSMKKSCLLTFLKQIMDHYIPHCSQLMPGANAGVMLSDNIPSASYNQHAPSNSFSQQLGSSMVSSASGCKHSSCFADAYFGDGMEPVERYMEAGKGSCLKEKAELSPISIDHGMRDISPSIDEKSGGSTEPLQNIVIGNKQLSRILELSAYQTLMLPDHSLSGKVVKLAYLSGEAILALTQHAMHKLWRWHHDQLSAGKEVACMEPQLFEPSSGKMMINEVRVDTENAAPCFALSGSYLFSASGWKISIFDLETFEKKSTFATPPPAATYITFLPQKILAIGFDDFSICIRCLCTKKTVANLKGHQNKITCLAFSPHLNVLVSSGADGQLCVWSANSWLKVASEPLQSLSTGQVPDRPSINYIQFHHDQIRLLVVHERQLDIYEAPRLKHLMQWVPQESNLLVTSATFSCDGQLIYVSFDNGCLQVVTETMVTLCQISSTAYIESCSSSQIYPLVIASHPFKPNQIALGLSNGRVHLLELLETLESEKLSDMDGNRSLLLPAQSPLCELSDKKTMQVYKRRKLLKEKENQTGSEIPIILPGVDRQN